MFAKLDADGMNKVRYLFTQIPPHARLAELGIKGKNIISALLRTHAAARVMVCWGLRLTSAI